MDCQQFLARFSDYLDGRIEGEASMEIEGHRDSCEECRRYAQTLQTGLDLLRDLPSLDVPPEFYPRLNHFISQPPAESPARGSGATLASVISVAALVATAAWAPTTGMPAPTPELPAVVVAEPPAGAFTPPEPAPTFRRNLSIFSETEFQDGIWGDSHKLLREYSPILDHRRSQPLIRVGIE
jgi:anti-sigma factor RsiW